MASNLPNWTVASFRRHYRSRYDLPAACAQHQAQSRVSPFRTTSNYLRNQTLNYYRQLQMRTCGTDKRGQGRSGVAARYLKLLSHSSKKM
eukprot:6191178-Pleurochrysis_carterae.AAC.1